MRYRASSSVTRSPRSVAQSPPPGSTVAVRRGPAHGATGDREEEQRVGSAAAHRHHRVDRVDPRLERERELRLGQGMRQCRVGHDVLLVGTGSVSESTHRDDGAQGEVPAVLAVRGRRGRSGSDSHWRLKPSISRGDRPGDVGPRSIGGAGLGGRTRRGSIATRFGYLTEERLVARRHRVPDLLRSRSAGRSPAARAPSGSERLWCHASVIVRSRSVSPRDAVGDVRLRGLGGRVHLTDRSCVTCNSSAAWNSGWVGQIW